MMPNSFISCNIPVRLISGKKSVANNAELLSKLGKCCLIVTGSYGAKVCGALGDAVTALTSQRIRYGIFDRISANPLVSVCVEAGKAAREIGAEFILGIGGGSAMDAAKAIAVFAANEAMEEDAFYSKAWGNSPLPIALIGTTAGTGSEVTKVTVLTDSKGRKHSVHDERLYAKLAFGNAEYTRFLSHEQTISTGVDIIAHCAESYFSKKSTSISRAYSVAGIRLAFEPLEKAALGCELGSEDRRALYEASIIGGLAINITGTCFPHNVGYYLTERFGTPHGMASAAFLNDMLYIEEERQPVLANRFYSEILIKPGRFKALLEQATKGIDLGISEAELNDAIARWENNSSVNNTLGDVTLSDITYILKTHFGGNKND